MGNASRRDQIYSLLEIHGQLSVTELAEQFGVTETTIRRDLIEMEEQGEILRKRGFAILPDQGHNLSVRRRNVFQEEKQRIAAKAMDLCKDVHSIALDSGTTVEEMTRFLVSNQANRKLEIITCSLTTALEASKYFHTYVPNGMVFPGEFSICGTAMTDYLENITADITFLGTNGIASTPGLTVSYLPMLDVKHALMKCAAKRVGLADSSKFTTRGLYTFCNYEELDVLITIRTEQNARFLDEIAKKTEVILA